MPENKPLTGYPSIDRFGRGHELPVEAFKRIVSAFEGETYNYNPTAYLYDLFRIQDNLNSIKRCAPSQVKLYYAMKANPEKRIMEEIASNSICAGVEIASSGELEEALCFWKPEEIIFTGPGKTIYELEKAIMAGIRLINIESPVEALRIQQIAEKHNIGNIDILLRVNLNYMIDAAFEHMSGCSTKMGIDEDELKSAYKIIKKLDRVTVKGLHVFAASGVLDFSQLIKCADYIFRLVKDSECYMGKLQVIDLGGGIGIDYSFENQAFDIDSYFAQLDLLISNYQFEDKEFIMELGTYVVGNAGYYCAKIVDIKRVKGKKHIILAGGVNHMGLPLEMRRKYPVEIIPMHEPRLYKGQPYVHNETADISGPLCMVTDCLCWNELIPHAEIGDIAVFFQSGAYCYEEGMHGFLRHPLPNVMFLENAHEE